MSTQKCPVCGIVMIDGNFYWSSNNSVASANEVKAKVCKHARKPGCINQEGFAMQGLGWGEDLVGSMILDQVPDYTTTATEILTSFGVINDVSTQIDTTSSTDYSTANDHSNYSSCNDTTSYDSSVSTDHSCNSSTDF